MNFPFFHKSLDFWSLECSNSLESPVFFTNSSSARVSSVWFPWISPFFHESLDFRTLECLNPVKSPFFSQIPRVSESRVFDFCEFPRFFTNPSTFGLSSVWIPWNPPFFLTNSSSARVSSVWFPWSTPFFHESLDFRTLECLNSRTFGISSE